jgi:NRAMP (natural resistance-associated macrophage protein)-like metal ion transporter
VPRRSGLVVLAAVVGPGVLAGLSDDDPAGITTYSILGAEYGYELLWVLLISTVALMVFHELGMRMGVATGQGLTGLVRQRFGVKAALVALTTLVIANLGTTCAEFAGVAASLELAGVTRYVSVPLAAVGVSLLVMRGGFRRVEHVLLALASVFATYIAAGVLAGPDWGATARGLVVPSLPADTAALVAATATVGTTLAPWGLAFIQSYAVDKRLTPDRLRYERIDVFVGAAMTGVIGVFVVIACAATLFPEGRSIDSAADAATALEPLAGGAASLLFGAGLLAAALLAASILPLSTAYSITETLGYESAIDDPVREAPLFYGSYAAIVAIGAGVVLIPGAPLIELLYLTQALNAILLLPLMVFLYLLARDRRTMGELANGRAADLAQLAVVALVALCVGALAVLAASG